MADFLSQISKNLAVKRVGIEEFAESSDYCNKRLYPRQKLLLKLIFLEELTDKEEDVLTHWIQGGRNGNEILISSDIRERIEAMRKRNYTHFREIVLVGGRRSSKGFITGLAMAKLMYDTMQLQDPGTYYGIDSEKEIYFACIAASQDQARKYQYADLSSTVKSCAAMQDNIYKVQELEFSVMTEKDKQTMGRFKGRTGTRDTSKLRGNALAANASTVRGMAAMALCFDEMAFMQQEGESSQTAAAVYDAATPALAQFGRDSMIFCNSSPYTKLGKFYERFNAGLKLDENGRAVNQSMFSFQFPSWALFEGYQEDRRFQKAITASPDWDPDEKKPGTQIPLWSEDDKDAILEARVEEKEKPDAYKVERRGQWAEIMDAFLRPEMVDRAFMGKPTREEGVYMPMRTNWNNSSFAFKYKAHLDPSSTTAGFGFAMGHVEELEDHYGNAKSHVIIDIVQRWQPNEFPEGVVNWETVMEDLCQWIDIFRPYEVTFDQFQSAAPIQWLNTWLRKSNMSEIRVYEKTATAQHNWNRAEVFRTALYQDLVHIPSDSANAQWASLELKNLQQVNTSGRFPRIDKPEIGPVQTKDMADCLMEVTDSLIGNLIGNETRQALGEIPISLGAPGGFQIGGGNRPPSSPMPDSLTGYYGKRTGEQNSVASRGSDVRSRLDGLGPSSGRGRHGGSGSSRSRGF